MVGEYQNLELKDEVQVFIMEIKYKKEFQFGFCKKFHTKILLSRHFMISFMVKSCAWLQQVHIEME